MGAFRSIGAAIRKKPLLAALLAVVCVLMFSIFAPCFQENGFLWPDSWRYADSSAPMLMAADGYYYLERAAFALEHGADGIPFLSRLAAYCTAILPLSLEWVAFLLPLFFSLALSALALAWGTFLRITWPARIAGTALCLLLPAWLERSGPGWFDTDPLIAVFWQGLILGLSVLAARKTAPPNGLALGGLILCAVLLPLAWKPGLGLVALAFGLWLIVPQKHGGCPYYGSKIRLTLLGIMLAAALFCALAPAKVLPLELAQVRDYFTDHFSLAFGEKRADFYRSVAELGSLSAGQWLEKIGGSVLGGILALCAALAAFRAVPPLRFALWLSFLFLILGFVAERFVYLGAFMPIFCVVLLPRAFSKQVKIVRLAAYCAAFVCLISCAAWTATRSYPLLWQKPHDTLALQLRELAPKDAALWNWWDDGYFLQARSGLTPLFHGGSQTALMAEIAARPLVMEDPLPARRWMRFFALRGSAGLDTLNQVWGEKSLDTLELVFRASDPQIRLAALPPLQQNERWLFPEGRVFLFLPARFLDLSRWWVAAARPDIPAGNHLESLPAADFTLDAARRSIRPPRYLRERGYAGFGAILAPDRAPLGPPWPSAKAPYLIYSPRAPRAYIADEIGLRSLALRLFSATSYPVPGFTPISVDANWGGLWEILP